MTRRSPRRLRRLQRNWDRFAEDDPAWAILTDPGKSGGGWDLDEFLATGEAEVERWLPQIDPPPGSGLALDVGAPVVPSERLEHQADVITTSPEGWSTAGSGADFAGPEKISATGSKERPARWLEKVDELASERLEQGFAEHPRAFRVAYPALVHLQL